MGAAFGLGAALGLGATLGLGPALGLGAALGFGATLTLATATAFLAAFGADCERMHHVQSQSQSGVGTRYSQRQMHHFYRFVLRLGFVLCSRFSALFTAPDSTPCLPPFVMTLLFIL